MSRFVESLFWRPIHALKVSDTSLTSGKGQVGPDALPQHDYGLSSPCRRSLQACHAIFLWVWQINHSQKLRQSRQVAPTLHGWLMRFLLPIFLQNLSLTSKFSVTFPWRVSHNAFSTLSVMECAPERWNWGHKYVVVMYLDLLDFSWKSGVCLTPSGCELVFKTETQQTGSLFSILQLQSTLSIFLL